MRKTKVLETLLVLSPADSEQGATTDEIAHAAGVHRQNASADLNQLCREGLARKSSGRPVLYFATTRASEEMAREYTPSVAEEGSKNDDNAMNIIGAQGSLRMAVEQAKAAIHYPPRGLPTLILGPTGSGKSHLAELMYTYGLQSRRFPPDAPFNVLNCADYAANPQLLLAQLFGYAKGSFTGADHTTSGLIANTENGVLFLDEIHRLPPEGQEMLFLLMDKGVYRMLGDGAVQRRASVTLIAATSEDPHSVLLKTLLRRFPVVISLPELNRRPLPERLALVELFLREEAARVRVPISVSPLVLVALLTFHTVGNVGEIRSAILLGCAKSFLHFIRSGRPSPTMPLYLTHLSPEIQLGYLKSQSETVKAEQLVGVEERVYLPETDNTVLRHKSEYGTGLDLYADLQKRMSGYLESALSTEEIQRLIEIDVDYYSRRLRRDFAGVSMVSDQFLAVVDSFIKAAGKELGETFSPEVVTGLALHLASSRRAGAESNERTFALVTNCSRQYGVVRRMAHVLEKGLERRLTTDDLSFLALFLAAHQQSTEPASIAVIVICHGERTASSMAEVANELLGEKCVSAVDMPLYQSVDDTLEQTVQRIKDAGKTKGVLLLVDMGSLTSFGATIQRLTGIPSEVLPLATTAAAIEAGRLSSRGDIELCDLATAVKQVYSMDFTRALPENGKRIILTTCLTGQGTARKLAAFLTEALPVSLRDSIAVHPVDLENGSQIPGLLVEGWRGTVIAAAGTVNPHLPGVTFVGMEQILFGEGIQTLITLSEQGQAEYDTVESLTREDAVVLARRFVTESIGTDADGEQFAADAMAALRSYERISTSFVTPSQAARWVIHLAFAIERLTTDGLVAECSDIQFLRQHHQGLLDALEEAVTPIIRDYGVEFPEGELGYLALIVLS